MNFQEPRKNSWLRCRECKCRWGLPQERLLEMASGSFFRLLFFSDRPLPCGHSFCESSWEVGTANLEVTLVEPLSLELRGPILEGQDKPASLRMKEDLMELLQRAEKLVESQLSTVLRDFRQVGPNGRVPRRNAWFFKSSDERALKCAVRSRSLLEASALLRRSSSKLLQWEIGGELRDVGMACHVHRCLVDCSRLLLAEVEPASASEAEDEEILTRRGLTPKVGKAKLSRRCTEIGFASTVKRKVRSVSASPKFSFYEEREREPKKSLDDSSLEPLLYMPKWAMDPRQLLKRVAGEAQRFMGEPLVAPHSRTPSNSQLCDTWASLSAEPRKVLENAGYSEPYDLSVNCGMKCMAIPLPFSQDDPGAIIAHALLSPATWGGARSLFGRLRVWRELRAHQLLWG